MDNENSVITREFDRSGRYEAGLKSLVRSLQVAFALLLIAIIGMLIYFISWGGYFSVEPQQAVIVMRFGKIIGTYTAGGHWFLPYPVNQFIRVQTNQQLLNINFASAAQVGEEQQDALEPGRDNYLITGDANIVQSSWTIAYRVANPQRYYEVLATPLKPVENGKVMPDAPEIDAAGFSGTRGPRTLLTNLFHQAVIEVTSNSGIEDILYAGQSRYSEAVQRVFSALVQKANCGIEIENVGLNRIYPPAKTRSAFDEVTAAGNTRSKLRDEAEAYRIEAENDTLAKRAEILASAETYEKQVVATVKAESRYFESIYAQYQENPQTVLMALYTSALSEAMRDLKENKFVLGSSGKGRKQLWLKLNPETRKPGEAAKSQEEK